jgi:cell division protein FtsB
MRGFLTRAWVVIFRLGLTLFVIGLLAGTGYAFFAAGEQEELRILSARLEKVRLEVEQLKRQNRRYKLLILNMGKSEQLQEKLAREDSGLVKEGEILYLFPE